MRRVLLPGAAPAIAETLRLVLGWAWTYVIVAELIGASSGIGHMITDSQALLATDQIIFGIIVIGVIGLVSDFAFKGRTSGCSRGRSREERRAVDPSALVDRRRRRASSRACAAAADAALRRLALGRRQRLHHHPRALGLRQVDAAAHRRRARHADRRARCCSTAARVTGPAPTAAWCSRATRCSPG